MAMGAAATAAAVAGINYVGCSSNSSSSSSSSRSMMMMDGSCSRIHLPIRSNVAACSMISLSSVHREVTTANATATSSTSSSSVTQQQKTASSSSSSRKSFVPAERVELLKSLEGWAEERMLPLLKPVDKCWQPQDFLPDPESDEFMDQVMELRGRTANLPDDYLVCLVGDMITEEALPTYQTMFNTFEGVGDETGCSTTPWAKWVRAWTAEENRHGDLLNKYLYLSGRVDLRMIEKTIQYLIGAGMATHIDNDPYNGFIYTSFQERATFVSHGNTARFAKDYGDSQLAGVCGVIASDEKRHEIAYTRVAEKVFEMDPNGAVMAFANMMRKKITMPAHLMYDGENEMLFEDYSSVAQRCKVYTASDYTDIMEHLIRTWNVEKLQGLSHEAQQAQEYLCGLPSRFRKLAERSVERSSLLKVASVKDSKAFSWIFNRHVDV